MRNAFACYYACRALQMMTWWEVKCPVTEITLQQIYKRQDPKHLKSNQFSSCYYAKCRFEYF